MGKVIKAELSKKKQEKVEVKKAGDDAMERLVRVMTDSPTLVRLAGAGWEVRALKPAVQWEIAKLACGVIKVENASYGDVLKGLAGNIPDMAKVITYALLNDKRRIEEEFDTVYDTLMWEGKPSEWAGVLFEILNLMDVNFFFAITQTIDVFRQTTLQRKMTLREQSSL